MNTNQTDGCDIVTIPLNKIFKNGLFVAINNERNFYFYDLGKLGLDYDSSTLKRNNRLIHINKTALFLGCFYLTQTNFKRH